MKFVNLVLLFIMGMTLMNYAVIPNRCSMEMQVCVVSCDIYHGFMADEQASSIFYIQHGNNLLVVENPFIIVSGYVPTTGFTDTMVLDCSDTNITNTCLVSCHV